MKIDKEFWMAFVVMLGYFIIPEIDNIYITPKLKESGLRMEVQCHDDPKNCWLQVKGKQR